LGEKISRKKIYTIGWWIICALVGMFFPSIGYQITTWQWWVGSILFWTGGWCCLNMGMETK